MERKLYRSNLCS